MWYTLDGGLHNYTFTENETIDQSAWDAMNDGIVTLKFYALDITGYMGSSEVNIEKYTQAPLIVIITVISIVGGVIVIAGIYIFMKKRKTPE